MKTKSSVAVVLVGVMLAVSSVSAMPGEGKGHKGPGQGPDIERMIDRIPDLTKAQEQQIYAIVDPVRSEMRLARREIRDLHRDLQRLIADEADEATVNEKIDEIAAKQAEQMKKRTALHRKITDVLTEEQRGAMKPKEKPAPHGKRPRR